MSFLAAMLLAMTPQAASPQTEAPLPAAPIPPNPCAEPLYHQFDFWVGEWNVYQTGTETQVATSRIEQVSNGCAIRETWMPLRGAPGTSLSTYDPFEGNWYQLWIGPEPGRIFFTGGLTGEAMVLTGYWGVTAEGLPNLVRMTYTRGDDGSVRQFGERSADHGLTWAPDFDLTYRPQGA